MENRLRDCVDLAAGRGQTVTNSADEHSRGSRPLLRSSVSSRHFCVVTETYPPEINGVALTLSRLVEGLRDRGSTVSVVRPKVPRAHEEATKNDRFSEDILVRGLPLPGYHGLQFGMPAARRLRQAWEHRRPAAVYVATEGPLGWSAVRAARSLGIPIVSGFHTNFHRYCTHYGVGWLQNLAFRYMRWFHNRTDCTLVSNEELRSHLRNSGFKEVKILERGVDSLRFSPCRRNRELRQKWRVLGDNPVLLYVGRIAAEKNLGLAIEAYRAIRQLNEATRFVLVGDGPLRGRLEREHPDLIFAGVQTGEALAQHYASADVFLFPSETETFGNVTLEAMASGLAVVAYDYACAKLHITHYETGVLVPFGDEEAFVKLARDLIGDPLTVTRIRRQARHYVSYLDWPRVVEKFEALLTNIDNGRPAISISSLTGRGLATKPG